MGTPNRIDRWAKGSLLAALVVALAGLTLRDSKAAPFWGGLLLAFGEAALVGGLADWFAVRALFVHPFGIPFPHTALVPRNRKRIIAEISHLVQHEWLPRSLLVGKVANFDFVGGGLLPVLEPLKPHLREVLRSVVRDALARVSPENLAAFLARGVAGSVDEEKVGPFLADLAQRAREQGWLEPLLREWVKKLQAWADSAQSRAMIHLRLEQAASAYRQRGPFKALTYQVAELFGGVDLDAASTVLQEEIKRFAEDQLTEQGQLPQIVREGLKTIECRLREEPAYLNEVRRFLVENSEEATLGVLLQPVLVSLRGEGLRELEGPESRLLAWAMDQLDRWLERVTAEGPARDQVNAWCRGLAESVIEQHHSLLGVLVAEQLGRLSEENLSELIQARVGEDLNWIRLNGTFVGGLVGVVLYLLFTLVGALL
jgi:uncharacterized membrane-anchored protein YjiN (DUF445 family)